MKIVSYAKEFFRKGKNCFCFKARVAAVDLEGEGVGHLFYRFLCTYAVHQRLPEHFFVKICNFYIEKFGGMGKSSYICSVITQNGAR